jgi:glycosyltransferase involved in cell wall biosynthesis
MKPLVSIHVLTYNHEPYIAQCLEGAVSQKTKYSFEIVIGEDCSTDRTREIVLAYQKKYPNLIRILLSKTNLGMMKNSIRTLAACRGKYVAFCEGDDYWTDPNKIATQVQFLETNTDCTAVIHAAEHHYRDKPDRNHVKHCRKVPSNGKYAAGRVILHVAKTFTTASLLCRSEHIKNLPEFYRKSPYGDYPLMLILAVYGRIGYLDRSMCVYRAETESSWTRKMNQDQRMKQKHYKDTMLMLKEFNSWTGHRYCPYVWFSQAVFFTAQQKASIKHYIGKAVGKVRRIVSAN